jgi:hypothetical protein
MNNQQLLEWAANVIRGQQEAGSFSVISIHIEAGKITRAKIEISEKPPVVDMGIKQANMST